MAQITWTETEPGSDTWNGTLNGELWFQVLPQGFFNSFWIDTKFPHSVTRNGNATGSLAARNKCQAMVDDFVALLPTLVS